MLLYPLAPAFTKRTSGLSYIFHYIYLHVVISIHCVRVKNHNVTYFVRRFAGKLSTLTEYLHIEYMYISFLTDLNRIDMKSVTGQTLSIEKVVTLYITKFWILIYTFFNYTLKSIFISSSLFHEHFLVAHIEIKSIKFVSKNYQGIF